MVPSRECSGSRPRIGSCPACAGRRVRPAPELGPRLRLRRADTLVRCRRCRLAWLVDPGPQEEYEGDYLEPYRRAGSMQGDVDALPEHLERRLDRMRTFNGGRPGRLLEVGCGFGLFLAAARDAGWDVRAVDVSRGRPRTSPTGTGWTSKWGTSRPPPCRPGSMPCT